MSKAIAIYGLGGVLTQAIAPPAGIWVYSFGIKTVAIVSTGLLGVAAVMGKFIKLSGTKKIHRGKNKLEKTAVPFSLVAGIITFATAGIFSFVPLLSQNSQIQNVSGFFITNGLGLLISRLLFSKINKKFSQKTVFYFGAGLFAAGFALLYLAKNESLLWCAGSLYGLGLGTIHPVLNTKAVQNCNNRAGAMSVFYTFQDIGVAAGSISCGFVAQYFSVRGVFAFCTIIVMFAVGTFFIFTLRIKDKFKN